ncbi:MerR family transcriptional regulator [Nocardia sp. JMUB6875]|uniref:MerR family transcriptional regulator n=1 Tax=Nocardia sp. JMUB6875 TaxID=3158170 RepID=UPI0032E75938
MLTISRLAAYAGVTVRAVRHYHRIGLLPEPARDRSGYRIYDAAAVLRLIRIHALASAGVPLARVQELLDAGPEEFTTGVRAIDKDLRAEIRRLQESRERLAKLAAGEHLALPQSVVDYLDRVRSLGVGERYLELERDGWIMLAAQVPDLVDAVIAQKHEDLNNPDMVRLYGLLDTALDWTIDDPRIAELADIVERMMACAIRDGEVDIDNPGGEFASRLDDHFVDMLDTAMVEASPVAARLMEIMAERGWKGWTRIERIPDDLLES